MIDRRATSRRQTEEMRNTDYIRFIILSGARTGSNMLASSLNAHPEIVCFRELFNFTETRFIGFHVDGYDMYSPDDRALRDSDYKRFLLERIFRPQEDGVRAVGFKMPYDHFWGYNGLLEWLCADEEIHVVHLQRRNLIQTFVSLRVARETGRWVDDREQAAASDEWVRRETPAVEVSPDACRSFIEKILWDASYYGDAFGRHPTLTVAYEDLRDRRNETLADVQRFLGAEPRALPERTRRQSSGRLRSRVSNHAELVEAFRGTEYKWMLDEAGPDA